MSEVQLTEAGLAARRLVEQGGQPITLRQAARQARAVQQEIAHPSQKCAARLQAAREVCPVPNFLLQYPPFTSAPHAPPPASRAAQSQVIFHYVSRQRLALEGARPGWPLWLGATAAAAAVGVWLVRRRGR